MSNDGSSIEIIDRSHGDIAGSIIYIQSCFESTNFSNCPFSDSGESLTLPNMVSNSAVATWLHFLQMDQYLTEFLDNGYDDLETAKKVSVIVLVLV